MLWLPMLGTLLSIPLFLSAFMAPSVQRVQVQLVIPLILGGLWTAPSIALTQNLAPVAVRAQASAIYVIFAKLIGVSTGPLAVGLLSDLLAKETGSAALGLRGAMMAVVAVLAWGAIHLSLAILHIKREEQAKAGAATPT